MKDFRFSSTDHEPQTTFIGSIFQTLCMSFIFIAGVALPFTYATQLTSFPYESKIVAITSLIIGFTILTCRTIKVGFLQQSQRQHFEANERWTGMAPAMKGKIVSYTAINFLILIFMFISGGEGKSTEMYYFCTIVACLSAFCSILAMIISLNNNS